MFPVSYRKDENTTKKLKPKSEWIEIEVPALIGEDTFRRAGEQLKKNTWGPVETIPNINTYFVGLFDVVSVAIKCVEFLKGNMHIIDARRGGTFWRHIER